MSRLLATLGVIWRLAHPYFFSEERRIGRSLLLGVVVVELSLVGINVLINRWQNRFFNSLADRSWDIFVDELLFFMLLAGSYVVLAAYQLYLQQWLSMRWRAWMTQRYLDRWLHASTHYRMQLQGDVTDNPDQRIADDIRLFADRAITIGIRVLGALVSLISFVIVLWILSADAPLYLFGREISIPGYLVWAALIYAAIGTLFAHLIGRPLIRLNFLQQRYEADFRFNLVRVRENAEQIALLRGENAEKATLRQRFSFVIDNWYAIMLRLKYLTFMTSGYHQASAVFPYLIAGPAYFAGRIQLGGLVQTVTAFNSVREAFSVFIDVYRDLAEWRAVIARLDGFDAAIAQAQTPPATHPAMDVGVQDDRRAIVIDDLLVRRPDGSALIALNNLEIHPGQNLLLTGPSGAGKSTLFRTLAGIWPFGSGTVFVPAGAHVMMLPQQSYFPVTTLAAAIAYPDRPESFVRDQLVDALAAVELPDLARRLDEEAHWNRVLSPGEQQRLGIARALLRAPDFLFLDEATASLDERAENALYELLRTRLPGTTVISIAHRDALTAFHQRRLVMSSEAGPHRLHEPARAAGA